MNYWVQYRDEIALMCDAIEHHEDGDAISEHQLYDKIVQFDECDDDEDDDEAALRRCTENEACGYCSKCLI